MRSHGPRLSDTDGTEGRPAPACRAQERWMSRWFCGWGQARSHLSRRWLPRRKFEGGTVRNRKASTLGNSCRATRENRAQKAVEVGTSHPHNRPDKKKPKQTTPLPPPACMAAEGPASPVRCLTRCQQSRCRKPASACSLAPCRRLMPWSRPPPPPWPHCHRPPHRPLPPAPRSAPAAPSRVRRRGRPSAASRGAGRAPRAS